MADPSPDVTMHDPPHRQHHRRPQNPPSHSRSSASSSFWSNPDVRERRHAALSILSDRELLIFHAVSAGESIPRTRQKFLRRLLLPPQHQQQQGHDTGAAGGGSPGGTVVYQDPVAGTMTAISSASASGSGPGSPSGRQGGRLRAVEDGKGLPLVDVIETSGGWDDRAGKK